MNGKMLIESLGVYLPAGIISTDEVLRGCKVNVRFPLQHVTGIENRRVVAPNEFSVELAQQASADCLSRSKYSADEIDLIISCDTSHSTGFLEHSAEPATAIKLKHELGLSNAMAFDVINACAGVFTGLLIVRSLLTTGAIRNALVVSGEHVTHLIRTAQLEIEGFRDPRLACLTVGDAGLAVLLERAPNGAAGFDAITLKTYGEHSALCTGKLTDRPHGGAIMATDSGMLARIGIEKSVDQTLCAMRQHGWFPAAFQHCIMHQTTRTSVDEAIKVLNGKCGQAVLDRQNMIDNLIDRGNTASTTHFVALIDHVRSGRIQSGDRVVFGIAASGLTTGTALYTLDDLPDRLREPAAQERKNSRHVFLPSDRARRAPRRVKVESVATLPNSANAQRDAISMLAAAAEACLRGSQYSREKIEIIINAGMYRDDFQCEPALASIVAGKLQISGNSRSSKNLDTVAFDLTNGSLGVLDACYVAAHMISSGDFRTAMVMAAEIEFNGLDGSHGRLGLEETGTALILDGSPDEGAGFGGFFFHSDTRHIHRFSSHSALSDRRPILRFAKDALFETYCLECISDCVDQFLELEGLDREDITVVIPPLISTAFVSRLAQDLRMPQERMVYPRPGAGDFYTSSLAFALNLLHEQKRVQHGDVGLIVAVGSGIQVGCAAYYF